MMAMLCFAAMDAIAKWLVSDYSVGQLMFVRMALLVGFAWLVVRHKTAGVRAALKTPWPWLQVARSLIWVIESAMFVLAFFYLPLADVHAVAAASPLIVIALGVALLGERSHPARWLAVGCAFAGVLAIVRPGFRVFDWPLLLPLGGAFLWAAYQVLTRYVSRHDSTETSMIWSALVSCAAAMPFGLAAWQWPTPAAWALMVASGALGAVAHYALIKAFEVVEAGAVQPYSYSMLVWVTGLGFVLFGDVPDGWTIAGAAIVVASGLFAWRHDRRAEKRAG
jgi:drug/metabolite transporter (DMT)-like permease